MMMLKRFPQLTILAGNLVMLGGLALLAWLGFYNRYWADDWCYSADARTMGTIPATLQYFETEKTGYSSNRYALTFFSAVIENTLGMVGNQLVGSLTIGFWLAGLTWVGWNVSRLIKPLPFSVILLAAGALLFYNLLISPQRFQILYWRSGVLPYSTAVIFWLLLMGMVSLQMVRPTPVKWLYPIAAGLAFLAAGLGEISCVFIFSATSLLLAGTWLAKNKKQAWAEKSMTTLLVTWLFLLLGMVALIISPSNARVENMDVKQSSLFLVPMTSARHALDFILFSLRGLPLPHAVVMVMMGSLGALSGVGVEERPNAARRAAFLAGVAGVTYVLIVAIQAPSAYFYSATPDPRGQSLARFMLLLGLAVMSGAVGDWLAKLLPGKWVGLMALVLVLAGSAYTARSFNGILAEREGFIQRAAIWDERDRIIQEAKAQGILLVEVPAIDTGQISTRDMFGSTGKGWKQFSKNCGARYYGVEGLKVRQ